MDRGGLGVTDGIPRKEATTHLIKENRAVDERHSSNVAVTSEPACTTRWVDWVLRPAMCWRHQGRLVGRLAVSLKNTRNSYYRRHYLQTTLRLTNLRHSE